MMRPAAGRRTAMRSANEAGVPIEHRRVQTHKAEPGGCMESQRFMDAPLPSTAMAREAR